MIVTFYSFKGGVGRSMALANIGRWLQLCGLDVVMVDWDLEAPGLESFFLSDPAQRQSARGRLGLLDLITTYKDLFPGLPGTAVGEPLDIDTFVGLLDEALPPLDTLLLNLPVASGDDATARSQPELGRLRLLTAGCRSEARFADYAETVQGFDWAQFYTAYRGAAYFEWLRRQLLHTAGAEVVLIDTRTGVAEMSGISTRQLADVVLVLCAPNDQNLEGVAMMAESFVRPDVLHARGNRRLDLIMVPARIDVSEGRPIDLFEARFKSRLDRFTPEAFKRFGTSFTRLRIPYISAYAFAERVAVGDPEGVKSLQESYAVIAAHLALLAPAQSAVRRQCKSELQRVFGMPTVEVGSLDAEGMQVEASVRARLDDAGLFAVQLPQGSPDAWFTRTSSQGNAPALGNSIVLCLGTESLRDGRIRPLWRLALENGVCLHFAAATPESALLQTPWPRWPRKARLWSTDREWDELVALLQRPCQAVRVPLLAPPPVAQLVGREAEIADLKQRLVEPKSQRSALALLGMAGIGKTSIARAVCDDDDVLDHFDGGVLWATLGYQADLTAAFVKLVRALDPGDGSELDLDEARRRLTNLLHGRRCLIVYDDIVDIDQMEMLPRGGDECRVLMTTRSTAVAEERSVGHVLEVRALSPTSSVSVLSADLSLDPSQSAIFDVLASRLGGSPLALTVANRAVRARARYEGDAGAAVSSVLRQLDESGLAGIDSTPGMSGTGTISSALSGALELLDSADRARLPLLASLPVESPAPISLVAGAAKCTADEARAMVERMATASFVHFDASGDSVTIHPLVHEFLRSLEIQQRRVEATRIVTAQPAGQRSIYISYRREDAGGNAGRIYDWLARQFGRDRVFLDTASISPGESFASVIASNLAHAHVMLVLIGPRWLELTSEGGVRRLDNPNDFVRLEVATALATGLRVVPVLINGARMPMQRELPPDLADLALRNAIEIKDETFRSDLDNLIDAAAETSHSRRANARLGAAPYSRARTWSYVAGAIGLVGVVTYWVVGTPPNQTPAVTSSVTAIPVTPVPGAAEFAKAEELYFGRDGTRDYAGAMKLYQQAADLGNASAQNSLGRMYELGDGVARNESLAIKWYRQAAAQGHPDAKAALSRLLRTTSSPQVR